MDCLLDLKALYPLFHFSQNGSDYFFNLDKLQGFRGKIIVDKTHLLVVETS